MDYYGGGGCTAPALALCSELKSSKDGFGFFSEQEPRPEDDANPNSKRFCCKLLGKVGQFGRFGPTNKGYGLSDMEELERYDKNLLARNLDRYNKKKLEQSSKFLKIREHAFRKIWEKNDFMLQDPKSKFDPSLPLTSMSSNWKQWPPQIPHLPNGVKIPVELFPHIAYDMDPGESSELYDFGIQARPIGEGPLEFFDSLKGLLNSPLAQTFRVHPPSLLFVDTKIGEKRSALVKVINDGNVPRRIAVLQPKNRAFDVIWGAELNEKVIIPPGLCAKVWVILKPKSEDPINDLLTIIVHEDGALVVPLMAAGPYPPILETEEWDCGCTTVGIPRVLHFQFTNLGRTGRFWILTEADFRKETMVIPPKNEAKNLEWPGEDYGGIGEEDLGEDLDARIFAKISELNLEKEKKKKSKEEKKDRLYAKPFKIYPSCFRLQKNQKISIKARFRPICGKFFYEKLAVLCDNGEVRWITIRGIGIDPRKQKLTDIKGEWTAPPCDLPTDLNTKFIMDCGNLLAGEIANPRFKLTNDSCIPVYFFWCVRPILTHELTFHQPPPLGSNFLQHFLDGGDLESEWGDCGCEVMECKEESGNALIIFPAQGILESRQEIECEVKVECPSLNGYHACVLSVFVQQIGCEARPILVKMIRDISTHNLNSTPIHYESLVREIREGGYESPLDEESDPDEEKTLEQKRRKRRKRRKNEPTTRLFVPTPPVDVNDELKCRYWDQYLCKLRSTGRKWESVRRESNLVDDHLAIIHAGPDLTRVLRSESESWDTRRPSSHESFEGEGEGVGTGLALVPREFTYGKHFFPNDHKIKAGPNILHLLQEGKHSWVIKTTEEMKRENAQGQGQGDEAHIGIEHMIYPKHYFGKDSQQEKIEAGPDILHLLHTDKDTWTIKSTREIEKEERRKNSGVIAVSEMVYSRDGYDRNRRHTITAGPDVLHLLQAGQDTWTNERTRWSKPDIGGDDNGLTIRMLKPQSFVQGIQLRNSKWLAEDSAILPDQEVEIWLRSVPLECWVNPPVFVASGVAASAIRRNFCFHNQSELPITVIWEGAVRERYSVLVEPQMFLVEPEQAAEFVVIVRMQRCGKVSDVIKGNLSVLSTLVPCTIPLELNILGPTLEILTPFLDFGLVPLGAEKVMTFVLRNYGNVRTTWRAKVTTGVAFQKIQENPNLPESPTQEDLDFQEKLNKMIHVWPEWGVLEGNERGGGQIYLNAETFGKVTVAIEVTSEGNCGHSLFIPIFGEIQPKSLVLAESKVLAKNIFPFIPSECYPVTLVNPTVFEVSFAWASPIGAQSKLFSVEFEPNSGVLKPKESLECKLTMIAEKKLIMNNLFVPCCVEGMAEPLVLQIEGEVSGLILVFILPLTKSQLTLPHKIPKKRRSNLRHKNKLIEEEIHGEENTGEDGDEKLRWLMNPNIGFAEKDDHTSKSKGHKHVKGHKGKGKLHPAKSESMAPSDHKIKGRKKSHKHIKEHDENHELNSKHSKIGKKHKDHHHHEIKSNETQSESETEEESPKIIIPSLPGENSGEHELTGECPNLQYWLRGKGCVPESGQKPSLIDTLDIDLNKCGTVGSRKIIHFPRTQIGKIVQEKFVIENRSPLKSQFNFRVVKYPLNSWAKNGIEGLIARKMAAHAPSEVGGILKFKEGIKNLDTVFEVIPKQGLLGPYATLVVKVRVHPNSSGVFVDELQCEFEGNNDPYTIELEAVVTDRVTDPSYIELN